MLRIGTLIAVLGCTMAGLAGAPAAAAECGAELLEALHLKNGRPVGGLTAWMEKREVPGVSIAVIRDFQIAWTWAGGTTEWQAGRPVDADTLFQAASISKFVSALASHRLAEQGKLDLDAPVSRYLKSWTLPEHGFAGAPDISTRLLLAHRAGLDRSGFDGYPVGSPLPTLTQILLGEPPANSGPVKVAWAPGAEFHYSGGGITAVQLMLEDVTGKAALEVVRELVLSPIGMTRSYFSQPLAQDLRENFASAHVKEGEVVPGGFHVYPELFAAGLWTTPTDLCQFAVAIQKARRGEEAGAVTPAVARAITTPLADGPTAPGCFIDGGYFLHAGGNFGMKCLLKAHSIGGYGFAIMTNSDRGEQLQEIVFATLAKAYGWEQ